MGNLTQGKMSKGGVNEKPKSERPPTPSAQQSTGMTNEEAIETLVKNYPTSNYTMLREAVDLAIESLKEK